jgi:hypothetical protein
VLGCGSGCQMQVSGCQGVRVCSRVVRKLELEMP